MDKFFKISERGSTVSREIIGGITTFFAMAYIMFVNPNTLAPAIGEGAWSSIFVATCVAAAIGCFLTAFMSNTPFAQAPGMGLNAFFTFSVCFGMGYAWQEALAIVFISGVIFLIIMISPLRGKVIASIPASLKAAISAGIGLFIAFIGFLGSGQGIIALDAANAITGLQLAIDGGLNTAGLLTIIGVLIIAVLMAWKVRGAMFIGIIVTTIIGIPMGVTTLPDSITTDSITMSDTFMKLSFSGLLPDGARSLLPLITAIISFVLVDMFDSIGTLIGTAGNAGMLDKDGNLPKGDRALVADAIATCCGALMGTSTVTTFVESSTGISEGSRTGLTSVVVGVLFLLAIVLSPIAGMIPAAATAPALIIVGVLMIRGAAKIVWDDIEEAVPCFLTIAMMPFAYSISDGIGFGFISYSLIKICRGKAKEVPVLVYLISAFFIAMYILKNI